MGAGAARRGPDRPAVPWGRVSPASPPHPGSLGMDEPRKLCSVERVQAKRKSAVGPRQGAAALWASVSLFLLYKMRELDRGPLPFSPDTVLGKGTFSCRSSPHCSKRRARLDCLPGKPFLAVRDGGGGGGGGGGEGSALLARTLPAPSQVSPNLTLGALWCHLSHLAVIYQYFQGAFCKINYNDVNEKYKMYRVFKKLCSTSRKWSL